jgi:2-phospho-L-lactate guanylyltransferase
MDRCVLIVPVKAWPRAKSRLDVPGVAVPELAAAFAADALHAALRARHVAEVVVVTDAEDFAFEGVHVVADRGNGDLNAALRAAADDVLRRSPGVSIAAMCADLPCLLTSDLDTALEQAAGRRAYVADVEGTGTTLLVAPAGAALDPRFGAGSAVRHGASGAVPIDAEVPTLRRDVDTDVDLAAAVALGPGHRTRAVLDRSGRGH